MRLLPARLALGAAIVLVLGTWSVGVPATEAATYANAAWWNGSTCDATHWNSVAKSLGWNVTLAPAHPLGAVYRGVPVCGPRPSWDHQGSLYAPNVKWSRSGWGEYEWQCLELSLRFMGQIYGVAAYGANGWNVVTNYKTAYGGGLTKYANPTVGKAPQPGDIIQFGTTSPGHTVVVAATAVDATGNGTLTVMSQNDAGSTTGWRTLTVTAWKVGPVGSQPATAWLHQNIITFSLPLGTVVTTQYKGQGVVFSRYATSSGSPYVAADTTSATSPVLSGSPAFHGGVRAWFVVPGTTTTATTVGTVLLDIGHITAANTIRVVFFSATGTIIKTVLIPSTGTYHAFATGAIRSVGVYEQTPGVGTFSIDNLVTAPNYT